MMPPAFYSRFKAVVPNDFGTVAASGGAVKPAAALFVGVGGDVSMVGSDGVSVVFKNVPSGSWIPVRVVTVNQSNTTATNIVALFTV